LAGFCVIWASTAAMLTEAFVLDRGRRGGAGEGI
jgi:hypothetical protein